MTVPATEIAERPGRARESAVCQAEAGLREVYRMVAAKRYRGPAEAYLKYLVPAAYLRCQADFVESRMID